MHTQKRANEVCMPEDPLAPPDPVHRALMLLQGEPVFMHTAPVWKRSLNLGTLGGIGPAEARIAQDATTAVVARPRDAVALRLALHDTHLFLFTEDDHCFFANCAAFAQMQFHVRDVLVSGMVLHAWLYTARSGVLCLGAYDLVANEALILHDVPAFERSARLRQIFEHAAWRMSQAGEHARTQRFEYVWVGQLGSDAALAEDPALAVTQETCTGACSLLYNAQWPYDVDVFVTVPDTPSAPDTARWIDATPARDLSKKGPRERVAALRIAVPPLLPVVTNERE
jgi:hypothetical protein